MRLPVPLLRRNTDVYKNQFGHVCVIAGSRRMLGAAALSSLAAMRAGAGLVTVAVPQSLNTAVQKKIANIVMTLPLKETAEQTIAFSAFAQVEKLSDTFDVLACGPLLYIHTCTQRAVLSEFN